MDQTTEAGEGLLDALIGRPLPERYLLRYLRDGYTLADAFRPGQAWGTKVFCVYANTLPPHDDGDIIRIAIIRTPAGYWLHRVEAIGGDPHKRNVFVKSTR